MELFNTLHHKIEEFKPLKKGRVGLYTCGPTVYNYAHIGNLRTYVFEDILKRVLRYNGYKVKHVMNITDVGHLVSDADEGEDKMEKGARREGKSAWDIAKFYEVAFHKDLADLNILPADEYPRATDHIKEQIKLIKKLEKNGFTYHTKDGIYFDTARLPDYGRLANLQNQELKAGARVDIGHKKSLTDFALWKFSPVGEQRQMEWPSPWGVGFPGWHVECSAMAAKYLGLPFDIHCGGIDHIPVHHTNEIAQTEAGEGKELARYWLHGEFLLMGSDRMAKSGDNFVTLQSLKNYRTKKAPLGGISPLAYRYFLLQTHYRKQLNFSWEALEAAQKGLEHLYSSARSLATVISSEPQGRREISVSQDFLNHINTDLDTPAGLALIWTALKEKTITLEQLLDFDRILGLQIKESFARLESAAIGSLPSDIEEIRTQRDHARAAKDWAKSDALRQQLENLGYLVTDTPTGTKLQKKS